LRITLEKQPALAAYRASLAAAQTQQKALDELRFSPGHDLSIRRQQACLGVTIAEAGLRQAEADALQKTTRLYFSVLYARTQLKLADEIVVTFGLYHNLVDDAVQKKGAPKEWTTSTVDKLLVYRQLADSKREEATQGIERATAALREAMGVRDDFGFQVADEQLPQPRVKLVKAELVAMARALRGEVVQASKAVELFDLEAEAQGKRCLPGLVPTFASGGDIHARPIPQDRTNGEYHPGGVPPEMPSNLAGSRTNRVQRAHDFSARASAVSEKTENLVVLEAIDFYYRALEAQHKVEGLREAAAAGAKLAEDTPKDVAGLQKVKIEDVLTNIVLSGQARNQFNEALWRYLLDLGALERVTGGGFCAGFSQPAPK
jgi:outer membrane protein TolC